MFNFDFEKEIGTHRSLHYGEAAQAMRARIELADVEERWFSVGQARTGVVLSEFYLWIEFDPAVTKVRIISARKSTQSEIRQYQENL